MATVAQNDLYEVALRIREMREICGFTEAEMAEKTEVSLNDYLRYEGGKVDFPFTFIHKCSLALGVGMSDLLEGRSAKLSSYTVTRKGKGQETAKEDGIEVQNLAPMFRNKIAEPYWVRYDYSPELQNKPIHLSAHSGQEFDFIMSGRLKVQVGENIEYLSEGDSIYYNSSTPHGMIAVDGRDCLFVAIILPGQDEKEITIRKTMFPSFTGERRETVVSKFVEVQEADNGAIEHIRFVNEETFNFAFDIVDAIARQTPDKLAMVHLDSDKQERRFTFKDMKRYSNQCANYFKALGIQKGDRVMVVMKRHYQFWFTMLGLHKLGAIAIPSTSQLQEHDFRYRFESAGIKAVICTDRDDVPAKVDRAAPGTPLEIKIVVGNTPEGWHSFDEEFSLYSTHFYRTEDTPCGSDIMLMFFTSGTTGYPKIAQHNYKYPLGHYITAKYWHGVSPDGLHFTISDTGWGKALWGKLYGQWLCEAAVFTYDFERFHAADVLPLFAKYHITTFCAPPTILRMMVREDISKYDFSSVLHMTTAGEALNPEVYKQFEKATGLQIMEGFGQTELTLAIGNLLGGTHKVGSMGKPSPLYDITLLSTMDGTPVADGEPGEIVVKTSDYVPCGLFAGYYNDPEATAKVWHDGYYHTGDLAWRDEDGFYWYVGRADDIIKSSGYRIGPFEIESVIMELPYVVECGVSAAPDPVRGQVVKASIVLAPGVVGDDALVKEIQNYVKEHTAPYKYPRIVVFCDSLPKTVNGKIVRSRL